MADDAKEQALRIIREKRDALLRERINLREQRAALAQRDRAIDREIADCVAAARVFGEALELPDDEDEQNSLFSTSVFNMLRSRASDLPEIPVLTTLYSSSTAETPKPSMPKIKDIVLDRLKAAGEKGTRAAPIHKYITETYGEQIHEKTVGMTLYRLSKQGLAHREGITWFFGPLEADTKNPGAGTPGSTSNS